jgi:hypothetical protein
MATVFTDTPTAASFILSEANGHRSRDNALVTHGQKLAAGEVAKTDAAFSLVTTGNTHSNTVLDVLAATTGLVSGETYDVAGSGIAAGTKFTFTGGAAGTLSVAAATTLTGTAITITRAAGSRPWTGAADTPVGISINDVDATTGQMMASFIVRDAEVNFKLLKYPGGQGAAVTTDLLGNGIIVRD